MARPKLYKHEQIVNLRLDGELYSLVKDLAAFESIHTGQVITIQNLIRYAIQYVYSDNERMRECFRRTRKPWKYKYK